MYFSTLQGQVVSGEAMPFSSNSGAPTECRAGTHSAPAEMRSSTSVETRVMMCMFKTTYGESVISMPKRAWGELIGPIENGTTYMVRPRMLPLNRLRKRFFIHCGSRQLLVGPASSSCALQMNVRSSTRATSAGSVRAKKLFGRRSGFSRMRVPLDTSKSVSCCHSAAEPSHQIISLGWVSFAVSATHC